MRSTGIFCRGRKTFIWIVFSFKCMMPSTICTTILLLSYCESQPPTAFYFPKVSNTCDCENYNWYLYELFTSKIEGINCYMYFPKVMLGSPILRNISKLCNISGYASMQLKKDSFINKSNICSLPHASSPLKKCRFYST